MADSKITHGAPGVFSHVVIAAESEPAPVAKRETAKPPLTPELPKTSTPKAQPQGLAKPTVVDVAGVKRLSPTDLRDQIFAGVYTAAHAPGIRSELGVKGCEALSAACTATQRRTVIDLVAPIGSKADDVLMAMMLAIGKSLGVT